MALIFESQIVYDHLLCLCVVEGVVVVVVVVVCPDVAGLRLDQRRGPPAPGPLRRPAHRRRSEWDHHQLAAPAALPAPHHAPVTSSHSARSAAARA